MVQPVRDFRIPTREDQEDFLIRLYFGPGRDYLLLCIQRAYLDFCRTLDGIRKFPKVRQIATDEVKNLFVQLNTNREVASRQSFDTWHHAACTKLCELYRQHGYDHFHVGQAQKWLNMTFKYVYAMSEARLPGYQRFYGFAHSPLDRILLDRFHDSFGARELSKSWSQLDEYEEYQQFQEWIRVTFPGSAPLAVEFWLWQQEPEIVDDHQTEHIR
jgi:hypothetical protein